MMTTGTQTARIRRISADFLKVFVLLSFLPVLSTAWIVSRDLATGVVSGKYFWFYGSIAILVLFTVPVAVIHGKKLRFSLMDGLVILFAGSVCLSSFVFSDADPNTTKLTVLFLLTVLYFCFRLFFSVYGEKYRSLLCLYIIITALVEAVWGLLQLYGYLSSQHNLFKLTGSFFNPGPYAGYLAVVAPLAVYIVLFARHCEGEARSNPFFPGLLRFARGDGYVSLITLIAILLVLPAAMSRAAWLAAIAGFTIVVYKKFAKQIKQFFARYKNRLLVPIVLTVLLVSIASTALYHLKKPSADGRLLTWKISLMTVAKHPMGAGLGNFSGAYGDTQAAYFASGKASETEEFVAGNPEYGFNEYLQIVIESGMVSFLLFAAIIVQAVQSLLKTGAGMAGSLVALLVFACFSYPFSVLPFLILFVFLIQPDSRSRHKSPVMAGLRYATPAMTQGFQNGYVTMTIASIILLLTVSFSLWKQYPVYKSYKEWNKNQVYYHSGLYGEVAESYKPLYPYLNDRIQFLFEYGRSLSNARQYEVSNRVFHRAVQISCDPMLYNIMGKNYQAMKNYSQAEACFTHAAQTVPNRLYPWYLLMKLYDETGLQEKALETAEIVLTKEPKVQSQAIREMREEAKKIIAKNNHLVIIFPCLFKNFSFTLQYGIKHDINGIYEENLCICNRLPLSSLFFPKG